MELIKNGASGGVERYKKCGHPFEMDNIIECFCKEYYKNFIMDHYKRGPSRMIRKTIYEDRLLQRQVGVFLKPKELDKNYKVLKQQNSKID